jgi:hypothetical protein
MKALVLSLSIIYFQLFITACTNDEARPIFKNPVIEFISVYSTDNQTGEVNINLSEVFQTVPEVGVVWSDKANPTVSDNLVFDKNVKSDGNIRFDLPNLQKNKTYFIRGFYKFNDQITYSTEAQFVQNYDGTWKRFISPGDVSPDEYISPEGAFLIDGPSFFFGCQKVNRLTEKSTGQLYYEGEWNPRFGREYTSPVYRQMIYNLFSTSFRSGNDVFTLYGGGYQQLPQNRGRIYRKSICISPTGCGWADYPGADCYTTAFGIGSEAYVLENRANGTLWQFNTTILKWFAINKVPVNEPSKFITFDTDNRAFVLVEPENINSPAKELYEYLPNENRWQRKADFVGEDRRKSSGFVVKDRFFFGLGEATKDGRGLRDIWEYVVSENRWQKTTDYPGGGTINNLSIGNNTIAVVGFGQQYRRTSVGGDDYRQTNDCWIFKPQ